MAKKKLNRSRQLRISKKSTSHVVKYIIFACLILTVSYSLKNILPTSQGPRVLGTSILLARGGDDSGEDSGSGGGGNLESGSSNSGSSGNSGSPQSSGSPASSGPGSSNLNNQSAPGVSSTINNEKVDCVGPDGKHFTTSFKSCAELNKSWGKQNFSFTPLNQSISKTELPTITPRPSRISAGIIEKKESQEKPLKKIEVETENKKSEINIDKLKTSVQITNDKGKILTKTESEGKEVELDTDDALKEINKAMEDHDVEVGSGSANNLVIKSEGVEAETHLPISVNVDTHTLQVTTLSGTKDLAVLPNQAVNNLIARNIITSVESSAGVSESSESAKQKVTLTELNKEPVFEVNGVKNKKLLGLIPVSFTKVSFVSAETGDVVKTDETLLNRLLEVISF
jgi:hypothetical protein